MNTVQQVSIPSGYFLNQSKNEYYDYRGRLIQELVQNSVDSGASEIHLNFHDDHYEMIDNGCGMSQETMVNALLTMGGSEKAQGNTGGFGHAKVLLLFSMQSYEIHSRNVVAYGEVLSYTMHEIEMRKGTSIKGWFSPEFGYDKIIMIELAKHLLRKCHLSAFFYINGERFVDWKKNYTNVRETEWFHLLSKKTKGIPHSTLIVRKNGMFMFEKYFGQTIEKEIILEVTGDSKDVFTANRDGLKGDKDREFSQLFSEICIDKESFDKNKCRIHIIKGVRAYCERVMQDIREVFGDLGGLETEVESMIHEYGGNIRQIVNVPHLQFAFESKLGAKKANDVLSMVIACVEGEERVRNAEDFIIDLGDSGLSAIPKKMHPDNMAADRKLLAQLWKQCILTVFEANKMDAKFRIGFTLNSDRLAEYSRNDGIETFLINPDKEDFDGKKQARIYAILITACHEVAHRYEGYHNESFSSVLDTIVKKTMMFVDGDTHAISKKAKQIKI